VGTIQTMIAVPQRGPFALAAGTAITVVGRNCSRR
jgi:hypothetical protein